MIFRRFLFAFALAFLPFAAFSSEASAQSAIPAGVHQLLAHMSKAWADRNLDDVMRDFHPDFKSIGRDRAAQRKFYEEQLFPYIKQWDMSLGSFRQEGNIAHVMLNIRTEKGNIPFPTQLILDKGRWYFYGNRE
ncbi:MAG: hypothetical protein HYS18_17185 [Burkholderiales bacterium]|nr:hypothetical protein [Burkholderiales bacterium]